jgi:hypothetical protein
MKYNKWIHSRKFIVLYWLALLISFIVYRNLSDFAGLATAALGIVAVIIGANAYEKKKVVE